MIQVPLRRGVSLFTSFLFFFSSLRPFILLPFAPYRGRSVLFVVVLLDKPRLVLVPSSSPPRPRLYPPAILQLSPLHFFIQLYPFCPFFAEGLPESSESSETANRSSASSFPPQPQHNAYRRYRGGIVSTVSVSGALAFTCENTVFCGNTWVGCIFLFRLHPFIPFISPARLRLQPRIAG